MGMVYGNGQRTLKSLSNFGPAQDTRGRVAKLSHKWVDNFLIILYNISTKERGEQPNDNYLLRYGRNYRQFVRR